MLHEPSDLVSRVFIRLKEYISVLLSVKLARLVTYRDAFTRRYSSHNDLILPWNRNPDTELVRLVINEVQVAAHPFSERMWEEVIVVWIIWVVQEGMCEGLSWVHALR